MDFLLIPWQCEDAASVAQCANNKKIAMFLRDAFPYPYTLDDAKWFVNDCIEKGEDKALYRAIVVDKKAVGSICVCVQSDVYRKSAELGYWLAEEFWGNGIMTAAVKQICKEAFSKFDIVRIYAEPFANNAGSRKVLLNSGFSLESIIKNGVFKNGCLYDYCIYSLLKEDFEQNQARK